MTFEPKQVVNLVGRTVLSVSDSDFVRMAQFAKDKRLCVLDENFASQSVHDLVAELKRFHQRCTRF